MVKKRKKSSGKGKQRRMDESAIRDVRAWFERMFTNARKALDLASRMSVDDCNESNDLFWALAKYAENVQESITQLDNINKKILPCLVEIPEKSAAEGDTGWADLKGMRARLAHQFWNIDPNVLWTTVTEDFPKLNALLSTLRIGMDPIDVKRPWSVDFSGGDLLSLGESSVEETPQPGKTLPYLCFDLQGKPFAVRIAFAGGKTLLASATRNLTMSGLWKMGQVIADESEDTPVNGIS